ncbi:lysoplasmalogenase TMEM86B isoform X2 [Ascaphus truei]|uniref:lysoplasmalogenase TMEM86B isoform X2 n=1 Tax=Ascaphus truei TaxID=8439 RepID=UPI003F59AC25
MPAERVHKANKVRNTVAKLLPFLTTCCIYFALWIPLSEPSWFSALIKCLPILSLVFFVVIHAVSVEMFSPYARKIFLGLLFSAVGDVCLIWPHFFLHGMVMFGLAHLMYTAAFGLRPLNIRLFILLALFCATFYFVTFPYLNEPFVYMVAGYTVLIGTMTWRALARVSLASYNYSWAHVSAALGAIIFMTSDCVLAVDKFCFPVFNSRAVIMGTYYCAQMLIALSVTGHSRDDLPWKKK